MIYEGDCSLLVDWRYLKIQIILDLLPASSSSILTGVVEFDRRRVHARETSKSQTSNLDTFVQSIVGSIIGILQSLIVDYSRKPKSFAFSLSNCQQLSTHVILGKHFGSLRTGYGEWKPCLHLEYSMILQSDTIDEVLLKMAGPMEIRILVKISMSL